MTTNSGTSAGEVHGHKKKKGFKLPKINLGHGKLIALLVGAAVLVLVTIFAVLFYGFKNESPIVKGVSRIVPYPAAIASGRVVTVYSYLDQLDILKNYYKEFKKMDLNSSEGKSQVQQLRREVLDRLVEDAIVAKEAKKLGVKVEKKELDESFDQLVSSNGGRKDFSEILNKYYGLTIDEFKVKIYQPRMLREKLTEKINSEENVTGVSKKRAEDLVAQIKKGADFAKLARENSGDPASSANGGDLGFFGKGKMVPEFEEAAFKLKKGEVSEPVRTVYGYHIIKVTDKKNNEVKASHILIKVRDFNEWLEEKKAELKKKSFPSGIKELVNL